MTLDDTPFIELVRRTALQRDDALAVDYISYRALWEGAGRVATRLQAAGVVAGDRVVIYCENRHGFIYAYIALLRLGAIAVPANVLYRSADLSNVLDDAEPRAVIVSASTRAQVPQSSTDALVSVEDIEAWAQDEIAPGEFNNAAATSDDIAVIIYTSGTTGRAKGALLTHGNLAAITCQIMTAWQWTSDDTLYLTLPLFHIHGLCAGLNGTLASGGRAILRERFDVEHAATTLRTGAITLFFGVPTMYVRFLERISPQRFSSVRLFVSGSAALPVEVHREFQTAFGASILERYGSTEFGFPLGNRYAGRRIVGSVGEPMSGVHVAIVKPGTTERVVPGAVGELVVSGPNVCRGYWRHQHHNDAFVNFDGKQWFRSGDLFRYDAEDDVYLVVGRLKELIISGGFNIYPLEVEAEMRQHAGVRDCALIGVADAARGERPVAYLETEPGFDTEIFLTALRTRLASFKVPKEVRVVSRLPRNAMGKVEKQRLIANYQNTSSV